VALQNVIGQQGKPWEVELVQFQDLTDKLDVLKKMTGIPDSRAIQHHAAEWLDTGSAQLLRVFAGDDSGYFHKQLVKLLEDFWRAKRPNCCFL